MADPCVLNPCPYGWSCITNGTLSACECPDGKWTFLREYHVFNVTECHDFWDLFNFNTNDYPGWQLLGALAVLALIILSIVLLFCSIVYVVNRFGDAKTPFPEYLPVQEFGDMGISKVWSCKIHHRQPICCDFSPDGTRVACLDCSGCLKVLPLGIAFTCGCINDCLLGSCGLSPPLPLPTIPPICPHPMETNTIPSTMQNIPRQLRSHFDSSPLKESAGVM